MRWFAAALYVLVAIGFASVLFGSLEPEHKRGDYAIAAFLVSLAWPMFLGVHLAEAIDYQPNGEQK